MKCEAYTVDEVISICGHSRPDLKAIMPKITKAVFHFNERHSKGVSQSRVLSVKDILQWTKRMPPDSALDRNRMFEESVSVFANHLKNERDRLYRARILSGVFQTDAKMADFYIKDRKCHVGFNDIGSGFTNDPIESESGIRRSVQIGSGIRLALNCSDEDLAEERFVMTRNAVNALEFLAKSVAVAQPVLLVGETGVGKTTAVQFLAKISGKNLHVINLNENTSSSDLLGSFR